MENSTNTSPFFKYGDEKAIVKLLKDSGFTAYDLSMYDYKNNSQTLIGSEDYIERAEALRRYADEIGIKCNQTHAPFATVIKGNEEYNQEIYPYLLRAVEVSGILGAKTCVMHPCNDYTPEENARFYNTFKECAEKSGVIICTENMFNWDREAGKPIPAACATAKDFTETLSLLDKNTFGACLDIGHAEILGGDISAVQLIHALGERLVALHIHDNDRRYDLHNLPYTNKLNFETVLKALRSVGYKGDITFESDSFMNRLPVELYPAGARFMAEMGGYFKNELLKK